MLKGFWDFVARLFGGYERGFKISLLIFGGFSYLSGGPNMLMYAGITVLAACIIAALIEGGK